MKHSGYCPLTLSCIAFAGCAPQADVAAAKAYAQEATRAASKITLIPHRSDDIVTRIGEQARQLPAAPGGFLAPDAAQQPKAWLGPTIVTGGASLGAAGARQEPSTP
jgi:hypothetical protein